MKPEATGRKYDRIAAWWEEHLRDSEYGLTQIRRAISYAPPGRALDVGCGAGGRVVGELQSARYDVTGLDVSAEMLAIARRAHPDVAFHHASTHRLDHGGAVRTGRRVGLDLSPATRRAGPVVGKLCRMFSPGGILIYTFGDEVGEHQSEWRDDTFYYSSIGIDGNLEVLLEQGTTIRHLELDQYPEKHVYVVAQRPADRAS